MKQAAIVAVLFCGLAFSAAGKPNPGPDKRDQSRERKSPPSVTLAISGITNNYAEHPDDAPTKWYTPLERPDWWLVCIALLTGLAIVYQAREMTRATKEMKAAGKLASDTAERQLRAYVCVDSALLKFPQPDVPEAQIHFKNCGQTPAYDVRGWIHTWFDECPLKVVLPSAPADLRKGTETLAPGRHSIFVAPKKPPLPPQFLQILGTPKFTLYVYGEVRYKDIFGMERSTKYRLIHGGAEGVRSVRDKQGVETWLLKPDAEGNDAT
jgi:hypothetical protein